MPSPDTTIICGGLPGSRTDRSSVCLDLSRNAEAQSRVELKLDAISRHLADNIPPLLADALEIATYVYSADRLVRRASPCMDEMNAAWRRGMHFRVPVRNPSVWNNPEISEALSSALGFLSDDYFSFEFLQAKPQGGIQPYLGFQDQDTHSTRPDEVLLFSGGLDSLGGAVDSLLRHRRKLVLVSHQSATQVSKVQKDLVSALRKRVGPRSVLHVPVWVTKGKGAREPIEYTQRTRSFLFTTLGVTVARMYGLDRVDIAENGVTSFNLPISEQAVGTLSSRTTHPRVLSEFGKLFSLLLDREIHINNRFIWSTKGEVVRSIADDDAVDLIPKTTSCAAVRSQSFNGKPCGVCSQCVERRFSIASAGLHEIEATEEYATDLFTGQFERVQEMTMVEQFVLRAHRHKGMTTEDFLSSYGQVFRAVPYLDGRPGDNTHKIAHLYRRHGAAVTKVIDAKLKGLDLDSTLALPSKSLLAMIRFSSDLHIPLPDPIRDEPVPSQEAAADRSTIKYVQFVMAIDCEGRRILFNDGPVIKTKAAYEVLSRLAKQYHEDQENNVPLKDWNYVSTGTLVADLKLNDEQALRKRVERLRDNLEASFEEALGYPPDRQDIVQSTNWSGYRLNPNIRIVSADQVSPAEKMSRISTEKVTSRPRPH